MSRWRLALAGLRHYWRTNLGLAAGLALAAAVLVGALCVGDSVRGTLRARALERVGAVELALETPGRTVRAALADDLADELEGATVAPVLRLSGVASKDGGARRANDVVVLGVDGRFLQLAPAPYGGGAPGEGGLFLNERLARQLEAQAGDELLLRVEKPSALSRDMILAPTDDDSVAMRARVEAVLGAEAFGRFALDAAPVPPYAAFVSLEWLQGELEQDGRANLLLAAADGASAEDADDALRERFTLADLELELTRHEDGGFVELSTPRVFLDAPVADALDSLELPLLGVLTYFVNSIDRGHGSTPYSMVTALGALGSGEPDGLRAVVPADLGMDEIVVDRWLADDLSLATGDELTLDYYVPGPDRRLVERTHAFTVRAVVPKEGLAADADLMPPFPGLEGAADCRDWAPGVPVELEALRDKDQTYWLEHGGAPKALVSLEAGQALWANRFGPLTSARAPLERADELARGLRAALEPADLGLYFRDVRTPALAAGTSATDFGGLFLGLSFFLIGAAILLAALLFTFGVEQRARELGTLLAVGFRPRDLRRQLLAEATLLALAGAAVGAPLGLLYTRLVLRGLATIWREAVASTPIEYHASALSVATGVVVTLLAALGAAAWALRGALKRAPVELLASSEGVEPPAASAAPRRARVALVVALVSFAAAAGIALTAGGGGAGAATAFFGAGSLLLVGALALTRVALARAGAGAAPRAVGGLGLRNAGRRPGRSLATAALLASGAFLVLSIGAHRKSADAAPLDRASGTGGFALYGRTTLSVHEDLETARGRETYGLGEDELAGVEVVSMRVRAGDDASCRNLGSPQTPRLLGVDPRELATRGAFTFAATLEDVEGASPWTLLERELPDGSVPAIGDAASVQWTIKKKLGDALEYVDGRGQVVAVRIVATVSDSILQGSLVIAEEALQRRFPGEDGYRAFLLDAPPERVGPVTDSLGRALSDAGLELTPTARMLDEFHAVQNTYLDVFQVLGGLGMLLGSLGLGVVVLRNALERRRELAVLRALGYERRDVRRLLLAEHLLLLALGLGAGAIAAGVALLPTVRAASGASPLATAAPILALLALGGVAWVVLAAHVATRGLPIGALRVE